MGMVVVNLWDGDTTPAAPAKAVAQPDLQSWFSDFVTQRQRIAGGYDGARLDDATRGYWAHADRFDADSANSKDVRERLVSHSRYEVANNGISDGIASTYATDLVGVGPTLRMQTGSKPFNQMVERRWYLWCKAVGFRRKLWTMAHAKHVDGEALAIMRINKRIKNPVKLDFALYETEQCQTPMPPIDPSYIDGIKLDSTDAPLWYDFLRQHPGKVNNTDFNPEAIHVPADRVLHWFKLRRPGQHRGVPECASTLNLGAAFRRLREASLSTAEKVAAWTLFFKTMFEPETIQAMPPMSTLEILHGMATTLPNSVEPFQLSAEQPGPEYEGFHKTLANEQGRPKGMPLNKTLCNSADYNYASGRLDHQTYYSYLDVDRADGDDCVLDPLFDSWFDLSVREYRWLGGDPESLSDSARWHVWDWPKHRVADVESEANANKTKLTSGQMFLHQLFADSGMDLEDEIEAAAQHFGVSEQVLKKRLLDVILPPPKQAQPSIGRSKQGDDIAAHLMNRLLAGPVNGNGANHV